MRSSVPIAVVTAAAQRTAVEISERFTARVQSLADPAAAPGKARFIAAEANLYGRPCRLVGVTTPPLRDLAKDRELTLEATALLFGSPIHEVRMLAVHRARRIYATAGKDGDGIRRAVVDAVLENVQHLNNWDLVDVCCPFILGDYIRRTHGTSAIPPPSAFSGPERVSVQLHEIAACNGGTMLAPTTRLLPTVATLHALATLPPRPVDASDVRRRGDKASRARGGAAGVVTCGTRCYDPTLFLRRIGVVTALAWADDAVSAQCALELAHTAADDEHDLMHKAMGWVLREVGQGSPQTLDAYLRAHCNRMPRVALRYAIEKLTPTQRAFYLAGGEMDDIPDAGDAKRAPPTLKRHRREEAR
jgi:3-methyladenine DNA glycosylase AlkD